MKILLSNDDGINAKGLEVLEKVCRNISNDITVVAPDVNMSGAAHSLTFKTPLRLKVYDDHHYSVNGTPTDSVVMAVRHVISEKPDLMMSGINFDSNLAEDISYSGTVSAAMEACLLGIPSIAFSQRTFKDGSINWDVSEKHGLILLNEILKNYEFKKHVLLNVNFPAVENPEDVKGVKITRQGFRAIDDHVIKSMDPRGDPYFWIGAADYRRTDSTSELETDLGATNNGFISITPISLDYTKYSEMKSLEEVFS